MKRRQFIALTSLAAVGTQALRSESLPGKTHEWQPDGAGSLAKIGVLTPAFDPVPESEMWAMAPDGISIHASRVSTSGRDARSFAENRFVDNAAEQLTGLKPRIILYAYTGSSYALGPDADEPLRLRLEKSASGIPVILTSIAATEALRALSVKRVALIHPPWFSEQVNSAGREYFRSLGFDVVFCARITPSREFTEVEPSEVYEWTIANVPNQAEAVFIGGNGLRAVGSINALEKRLHRPVLTANQVLLWSALHRIGLAYKVKSYGRVFQIK